MSDIKKTKSEIAIKQIMEAVTIKESRWKWKAEKGINPIKAMTYNVGLGLLNLLEQPGEKTDWGSELYNIQYFLKQILILLTKPSVLEKLPNELQEAAGEHVEKLMEFFREIDEGYTTQYLDYVALDESRMPDDWVERTISYYDFKNAMRDRCNFFNDYNREKEWFDEMQDAHKSINQQK